MRVLLRDRTTLLHWATEKGSVDLARLLIEYGADVKAQDKYQLTSLHLAVRSGSVDLTRLLIEHGADVTAQNGRGSTPLHVAVGKGSVDLTRLLIEHGADVTAQYKQSPILLDVVADVAADVVPLLFKLKHYADVKVQDKHWHGSTLLHLAVGRGSVDLTRLLIEHGADVTAQADHGLTLLCMAGLNGNEDLARLLIEHGARTSTVGPVASGMVWQSIASSSRMTQT